jgi:carboxylate-amine ligase
MGDFTFGIEEEHFLVDAETNGLVSGMCEAFFNEAGAALGRRVAREFLLPQVELITSPHHRMAAARDELRGLRRAVAEIAARHGLATLAAGTHPTGAWREVGQTPKDRYDVVMDDLQMIGQRDLLCGTHIHVELPQEVDRIDVMCRMLPHIPLLLALSTSSPFWQSRRTGLKGYRLAAYDELPRTGLPELFRNQAQFDSYVKALVRAGVMEDSSFVWWAIRPSLKHPTLELRAPDSCTLVDDSIALAALYRTLVRHLACNPTRNANIDAVTRAVAVENKWRAQRHGVRGTLVTEEGAVTVAELLDRVIAETADDADALGCKEEIRRCQASAAAGTSADAQLAVYEAHRGIGGRDQALQAVTHWIASATLQ